MLHDWDPRTAQHVPHAARAFGPGAPNPRATTDGGQHFSQAGRRCHSLRAGRRRLCNTTGLNFATTGIPGLPSTCRTQHVPSAQVLLTPVLRTTDSGQHFFQAGRRCHSFRAGRRRLCNTSRDRVATPSETRGQCCHCTLARAAVVCMECLSFGVNTSAGHADLTPPPHIPPRSPSDPASRHRSAGRGSASLSTGISTGQRATVAH